MEHQQERGHPGHRSGDVVSQDREVRAEARGLTRIDVAPLGSADREMVEDLCTSIRRAFRVPARIRQVHLDIEQFFDTQRVQYNSSEIISALDRLSPRVNGQERSKLLGVASDDLFIPILTYVFGEAQLGGDVAVVSYHRLMNERYGLPADRALLFLRLEKEAFHELGHSYGLIHCQNQDCVMYASTYVEDIDLKGSLFCRSCRLRIDQAA